MVLSWEALDDSGSVAEGGANVVIHEFAHKLDMMTGEADGVPPLPSRAARERWIEVFDAEFDRFCKDVDAGKETFLDPYAAEHEAEFFAVASEAFFESPNETRRRYPDALRAIQGVLPAGSRAEAGRMKTLLIVYHTGGVKTAQMAEAVERGARSEDRRAAWW